MQEFYVSLERLGNKLIERYIDHSGKERQREIEYQPVLFSHVTEGTKTKYFDIYGKPCKANSFENMKEAGDWIRRMEDVGLEAMGMNDYKLAYLSDTYGSNIVYNKNYIRIANFDIEVTAEGFPEPMRANFPIDAITHYDSIDDKFYVFDLLDSLYGSVSKWDIKLAAKLDADGGDEVPQDILDRVVYMPFDSEEELLMEYINLWEQKRPAICTGWNVEGFDIPYLVNRIKNTIGERFVKRLSSIGKVNSKVIQNIYGDKEIFTIMGTTILDYLDLYKKFSFTNQPSYKLDHVAFYETKRGKLKYDGPINKLRETNHQRYISYNIMDVESVIGIDKKRGFLDLALSLSYYSKMPYSGVMSPIKTWDAIIFNSLKSQHKVIPQGKSHAKQSFPGAFVIEPVAQAYKHILSFDLTSLYPSIIRQVNISPETIIGQFKLHPLSEYINKTAPRPSDEYSCSPNGWMYRKEGEGIIPTEIAKVFFQRKDWKNKMKPAERNKELVKKALYDEKFGKLDTFDDIDIYADFNDEIKASLSSMSKSCLEKLLMECDNMIMLADTNQLNRKILINSLYGALGNIHFRYYDLRNATAITIFGQLALQWIQRKVNEYLDSVCGTSGHDYVIAGDTDSIYVCVDKVIEKVGEHKFKTTDQKVEFLNKFAFQKMEPHIDASYRELQEYMNNPNHLMLMDREAISCPPLGSKGCGGFWKAKKRYALNVYDNEGTRYSKPKLKIMGMETQQSSTPVAVQDALEESIRRMLQEGEESLQEYYKQFEQEYRQLHYLKIAEVKTCNNIGTYDDKGWPGPKCPFHVRGALTYRRVTKSLPDAPQIQEGDKVMTLPLRDGNPFKDKCISWVSGTELPIEIREDVMKWLDYQKMFDKTFVKPLSGMSSSAGMDYEKVASLFDMFDM